MRQPFSGHSCWTAGMVENELEKTGLLSKLSYIEETMKKELNWLHISDIHFHPRAEWRDSPVRQSLKEYLDRVLHESPSLLPDFIFCTGDIAFGELESSPLADQYEQAAQFFEEIIAICSQGRHSISRERLFVVPGNHDVDRTKINKYAQQALVEKSTSAREHSSFINQSFNDLDLEAKDAFRRLNEYGTFVKNFLPHQVDESGHLCYASVIDIDGLTVGIAGFNSAWSCAGPEDDRTIWLPAEWQFNSLGEKISNCDVRIGLIHHPIDWLNAYDRSIAERRIPRIFHFWLHGHNHDPWVTPIQSHIVIGTGAIGAEVNNEFGINMVHIDLSESSGVVDLHEYSTRDGCWKVATIAGPAPDGHWRFNLPDAMRVTPDLAVEGHGITVDEEKPQDEEVSKIDHQNGTICTLPEIKGRVRLIHITTVRGNLKGFHDMNEALQEGLSELPAGGNMWLFRQAFQRAEKRGDRLVVNAIAEGALLSTVKLSQTGTLQIAEYQTS